VATTIDQPVVGGYAGPFGWPRIATVGQTITVPSTDNGLTEFTFNYASDSSGGGPIVRGEVYEWDGTKATGPGLWENPPRQLVRTTYPTPVTFQTGGIPLSLNGNYVLFVSISKDYDQNVAEVEEGLNDYSSWGVASPYDTGGVDPYPGGDYVTLDNEGNFAAWTNQAWTSYAAYHHDMNFSASFTTIGSRSGCGAGVLGAAAAAWLTTRRARRP
jgi:hypothetical protein